MFFVPCFFRFCLLEEHPRHFNRLTPLHDVLLKPIAQQRMVNHIVHLHEEEKKGGLDLRTAYVVQGRYCTKYHTSCHTMGFQICSHCIWANGRLTATQSATPRIIINRLTVMLRGYVPVVLRCTRQVSASIEVSRSCLEGGEYDPFCYISRSITMKQPSMIGFQCAVSSSQ